MEVDNKPASPDAEPEEEEKFGAASAGCGLVVALIAGGFFYLTWFQPDLLDSLFDAETSGRGARKVKRILYLIYNRVTGSVAGAFALLSIFATVKGLTGGVPSTTPDK